MKKDLLLAIDQGTTGSTALVMDLAGRTVAKANVEFPQHFPKPGWVEHRGEEILASVEAAVRNALAAEPGLAGRIAGIGITNQRETTVVWERATGTPIHNAIVWQCRRTADRCAELVAAGKSDIVRERTGLVIDAYFSGTKVAWILDAVEGARERAARGELAFGTIDSYLVHHLTGGDVHATDVTNASRTLLMNLRTLAWDDELLALFRVPSAVLPRIVPSAGPIGTTKGLSYLPDGLPIAGIAGDQQAALFGQACFAPGEAKCTYGTGAFILMNVGSEPIPSTSGLLTTVAWQVGGKVTYALEGSAFIAGAAVQWLRDGLGIISAAPEIEPLARSVPDDGGVLFVPALAGLGAPHWDADARGLVVGLTRGATKAHLARAVLEGIALEVDDLLLAMAKDAGQALKGLRVDGGASRNDLLMQMQSDLGAVRVDRPKDIESTSRGAAMLAGVGLGLLAFDGSGASASAMVEHDVSFEPAAPEGWRSAIRGRWSDAIRRCRGPVQP
jgi:glycerol kinase